MSLSQNWQELLSTALVGTGRSKPANLSTGSGLDSLWETLEADLEGTLLAKAVGLYLFRQSGAKPATTQLSGPLPAQADPRKRLSRRSQGHLKRMLRGDLREVLPEFLAAVYRADLAIPPSLLPALLDCPNNPEQQLAVALVLGPRGQWLAKQNPEWDWVGSNHSTPEQDWETGSGLQRIEALRQLRQTDPQKALGLLKSSWPSETPENRAEFLGSLETSLSIADEEFLETILDDKRKEVRKAAADLLARLPQSRLVARMTERVKALVHLEIPKPKGLIGRLVGTTGPLSLQVNFPESCDKAMQRDGIEQKNVPYGMGEKTWWLVQMVGMVPLKHWGLPADWIAAVNGESSALLGAWSEAAVRYGDTEWAEALLEHALVSGNRNVLLHRLFDVLSPEQSQPMLIEALEKYPDFIRGPFPAPALWIKPLVMTYLEVGRSNPENLSWVANQLPELVLGWPLEMVGELENWVRRLPQERTWIHSQADKALALLEFRKSMLEGLQQ